MRAYAVATCLLCIVFASRIVFCVTVAFAACVRRCRNIVASRFFVFLRRKFCRCSICAVVWVQALFVVGNRAFSRRRVFGVVQAFRRVSHLRRCKNRFGAFALWQLCCRVAWAFCRSCRQGFASVSRGFWIHLVAFGAFLLSVLLQNVTKNSHFACKKLKKHLKTSRSVCF